MPFDPWSILDVIFSPIMATGPIMSLTIISLIMSSVTVIFYKFLVDQVAMKEVKKNMENYREVANQAQKEKNIEKMNENVDKMMQLNKKYFSLSTKPLIGSLIFFMVIFPWVTSRFSEILINLPFSLPFIGNTLGWFGWYFLLAIPSNMVLRKLLDLD